MHIEKRFFYYKPSFFIFHFITAFFLIFSSFLFDKYLDGDFIKLLSVNFTAMLLPFCLIYYFFELDKADIYNPRIMGKMIHLLTFFLVFVVFFFVFSFKSLLNSVFLFENSTLSLNAVFDIPIYQRLILLVISVFCEELIFRGILFNIGLKLFDKYMIVIWSAVFYELLHFRGIENFALTLIVSISLYLLYAITKNIIISFEFHLLWNLMVLCRNKCSFLQKIPVSNLWLMLSINLFTFVFIIIIYKYINKLGGKYD